jgi:pyruvate/2-oxoglutarate dehydrogenase complex dihydrolipoamide dehydrogenase (E3) component
VTVASSSEHLLPREDADVAEVLSQQFCKEESTLWDRCRAVWAERHRGKKRVGLTTPQDERIVEGGAVALPL